MGDLMKIKKFKVDICNVCRHECPIDIDTESECVCVYCTGKLKYDADVLTRRPQTDSELAEQFEVLATSDIFSHTEIINEITIVGLSNMIYSFYWKSGRLIKATEKDYYGCTSVFKKIKTTAHAHSAS
jgi:hypothetical protein